MWFHDVVKWRGIMGAVKSYLMWLRQKSSRTISCFKVWFKLRVVTFADFLPHSLVGNIRHDDPTLIQLGLGQGKHFLNCFDMESKTGLVYRILRFTHPYYSLILSTYATGRVTANHQDSCPLLKCNIKISKSWLIRDLSCGQSRSE